MSNRDLGKQRRDYVAEPLRRSDLAAQPIEQFQRWYADAEAHCHGYPNPMILSTVDRTGQPQSRVVLLKSFSSQGFVFYTNYESKKAANIESNSKVSLLFFWEALERQVIVTGSAARASGEEADQYFASRPRGSQMSAHASKQSSATPSRAHLEKQFQALHKQYEGQDVPRPKSWGGYLVKPTSIEFWQGQPDRLHDRLIYSRTSETSTDWNIERLSP